MRRTLFFVAGQTIYYGCEYCGTILGEPDRSQSVWVVSYAAQEHSRPIWLMSSPPGRKPVRCVAEYFSWQGGTRWMNIDSILSRAI